jgi:DNA-directed RNA polymerase specialized sigma24 family protein
MSMPSKESPADTTAKEECHALVREYHRAGSKKAKDAVFAKVVAHPAVERILNIATGRYYVPGEDEEDMRQRALVELLKVIEGHDFNGTSDFLPSLYIRVKLKAITYVRSQTQVKRISAAACGKREISLNTKVSPDSEKTLDFPTGEIGPALTADLKDQVEYYLNLLEPRLTESEFVYFYLHYYSGLSYVEIVRHTSDVKKWSTRDLHLAVKRVDNTICRARRKCAELLEALEAQRILRNRKCNGRHRKSKKSSGSSRTGK